jgi:hypothetical protein
VILGLPVEEAAVLVDSVAEGDSIGWSFWTEEAQGGRGREGGEVVYVPERDQDRERAGVLCRGWEQGGDVVDRPRCFEVRSRDC